jgi:uncharacterized protein (TIGR02246 family)
MFAGNALRSVLRPSLVVLAGAVAATGPFVVIPRAGAQGVAKTPAKAASQPAASDDRKEERAAIQSVLNSFVKAFEARDPKALAAHWTAEGEYHREGGISVQGRATLEKGFTAFFAKTPEVKAELHPESLKFLAHDFAVEEGSVDVRRGRTEPASRAHYRCLFVREEGRWRLAQLEESPEDTVTIDDIGWLVGEWTSQSGQGAEIRTTYSWAANRKFLQVQFTIKEKVLSLSGNQVIGVDPATGAIRSWTFEANGGVGEADWSRDGDQWVLDASGTSASGATLKETNILYRVNDDLFTWQSVNRTLDDTELPDLAPVKVTRVKPAR